MSKFRVEVTTYSKVTYEVEAPHRSAIHDQFEDCDTGVPESWAIVHEGEVYDEVTFIRDVVTT